jgi:hypothetical protein
MAASLLALVLLGAAAGEVTGAATGEAATERPVLQGALKAEFRGAFIVNFAYNTGTLYPGNVAYYGLPAGVSEPQFVVSPANTVVGFKLSGLTLGRAEISGAMDVNLRSPTPLATPNSLLPQFYDVHMQLEFSHWRLVVGQYPDVVLPFVPDTLNSYPAGYVPGAFGYVHPQLRADARLPVGERFQANAQVSVNKPVQTFELTDEVVGRQAGIPDFQGRFSLAYGQSPHPWQRPMEIGVSGHWGRRKTTDLTTLETIALPSWSVAADLRLQLSTGTRFKARWWRGRLLGDYTAAVFQSINVMTDQAIDATGLWVELQQMLNDRWRVTAGYGRDDPRDSQLMAAGRTLNQAAFANVQWDVTKTLGFGLEPSRWITSYVDGTTNRIWRVDTMMFLRF